MKKDSPKEHFDPKQRGQRVKIKPAGSEKQDSRSAEPFKTAPVTNGGYLLRRPAKT